MRALVWIVEEAWQATVAAAAAFLPGDADITVLYVSSGGRTAYVSVNWFGRGSCESVEAGSFAGASPWL